MDLKEAKGQEMKTIIGKKSEAGRSSKENSK
jgi:hypothetical protein